MLLAIEYYVKSEETRFIEEEIQVLFALVNLVEEHGIVLFIIGLQKKSY